MPQNFYILPDDRGRWVISDNTSDVGMGTAYRSSHEAIDHLRFRLSEEGLEMGKHFYEGTGIRVEAIDPSDLGPMLYSAEALRLSVSLTEQFGRKLKADALVLAKHDGRRTVTSEDIMAAVKDLDMKDFDSAGTSADGK